MTLYILNVVAFLINLASTYNHSYAWLLAGRILSGFAPHFHLSLD